MAEKCARLEIGQIQSSDVRLLRRRGRCVCGAGDADLYLFIEEILGALEVGVHPHRGAGHDRFRRGDGSHPPLGVIPKGYQEIVRTLPVLPEADAGLTTCVCEAVGVH